MNVIHETATKGHKNELNDQEMLLHLMYGLNTD